MDGEIRIEYQPLGELKHAAVNPKQHDEGGIGKSFELYGFTQPPLIDERTGQLVAGHGRIIVLAKAKEAKLEPPRRVRVRDDGEWLVPVLRGIAFADEDEAAGYLITDNKLVERGGWSMELLAGILDRLQKKRVPLTMLGWTRNEIQAVLARAWATERKDRRADDDHQAAALQRKWKTKRGQVWIVPSKMGDGEHRILCGDSEKDAAAVKRLLNGEAIALGFTDPPYGIEYDATTWRGELGQSKGHHRTGRVTADNRSDWREVWKLWDPPVLYVCYAAWFTDVVMASLRAADYQLRQQIIWNKTIAVMSRQRYHWKHEPIWYAVKKGAKDHWIGNRKQTTVWDIAPPNHLMGSSTDDKTAHPTQKPIELAQRAITNHVNAGELVIDPFLGSGTTIVAAEALGRRCYGAELDPKYVAIILERLSGLGLKPHLEKR